MCNALEALYVFITVVCDQIIVIVSSNNNNSAASLALGAVSSQER